MDTSRAFSSFAVDDLAAAHRFYTEVLGMDAGPRGRRPDAHAGHPPGHRFADPGVSQARPCPRHLHGAQHPVPDVETAVDHLIAAGLSMERYEGFDQDERGIAHGNGPTIAWFLDPSGNTIAVLSEDPNPR